MDVDEIKQMKENQSPAISYHEFQRKLEEHDFPEYGWRTKGLLSLDEIQWLKEADDREEYLETWEFIRKQREKEMEEYAREREYHEQEAERRERR